MKGRNILRVTLILLVSGLAGLQTFSQTPAPAQAHGQKWIRVQSENGEFSIEVPDEYDYFFDEKGFSVSKDRSNYLLRDVGIFNSYRNGVLLSFDSYKTGDSKDAIKALVDLETRDNTAEKVKIGAKVFYQRIVRNEKYYLIRQYFATNDHVYILTAASRKEGAEEIDRFLKSRAISGYPASPGNTDLPVVSMSALKVSPLILDATNAEDGRVQSSKKALPKSPPALPPKEDEGKFVVVTKPRASYVDSARQANEQGDITLKMSFTARGGVSRVEVLRTLGNGLLRQTALTAMTLKYLPKEENGVPISVTKTIVYGFSIY